MKNEGRNVICFKVLVDWVLENRVLPFSSYESERLFKIITIYNFSIVRFPYNLLHNLNDICKINLHKF